MDIEERNQNNKAYTSFKSAFDVSMGAIYIIVSLYCLYFPWALEQFGKKGIYIFITLFISYGFFRIYRGIKGFMPKR